MSDRQAKHGKVLEHDIGLLDRQIKGRSERMGILKGERKKERERTSNLILSSLKTLNFISKFLCYEIIYIMSFLKSMVSP